MTLALAAMAASVVATHWVVASAAGPSPTLDRRPQLVIAHRGASRPEFAACRRVDWLVDGAKSRRVEQPVGAGLRPELRARQPRGNAVQAPALPDVATCRR